MVAKSWIAKFNDKYGIVSIIVSSMRIKIVVGLILGRIFPKWNLRLIPKWSLLEKPHRITSANTDDVRFNLLELVVEEINSKKVSGSVAELGVYKGDFSSCINELFPDRTLYMFDTFGGFDKRDISVEVLNKYSSGSQDFTDVDLKHVLQKMRYPDKCVIKKGYFPESLGGLEDNFCFVSLDADLYQPTIDGLRYFYPRLESGGYIFIHDYNNPNYLGVKKAVQDFCSTNLISYLPIPDLGGTVVILK